MEALRFPSRPLTRITTEIHRLAPHQRQRQEEVHSLQRVAFALSSAPWRRTESGTPSWNELPTPPWRLPLPPPSEPHPERLQAEAAGEEILEEGIAEQEEELSFAPEIYLPELHLNPSPYLPQAVRNRGPSTGEGREGHRLAAGAPEGERPRLPFPRPRARLTPARGSEAAAREAAELQEEVAELVRSSQRQVIPASPRFGSARPAPSSFRLGRSRHRQLQRQQGLLSVCWTSTRFESKWQTQGPCRN